MLDSVRSDIHAEDYIASRYVCVNSRAMVARSIATSYNNTMKSIGEIRLANLSRLLTMITQADLARRIDRSPGQVQQWALKARNPNGKGARNIDDSSARLIERALGLAENWMDQDHDVLSTKGIEALALPDAIVVQAHHPEDPIPSGFISIPAISLEVGAGHRLVESESPENKVRLYIMESLHKHRLKPSDLVAYRVRGNSMEPYLFDGDWVVIDRSKKQPPSVAKALDCRCNTFVFRYEDGVMVKMLQSLPDGGFNVVSLNTAEHKEFVIPAASVNQMEIFGKVVDRSGWSV